MEVDLSSLIVEQGLLIHSGSRSTTCHSGSRSTTYHSGSRSTTYHSGSRSTTYHSTVTLHIFMSKHKNSGIQQILNLLLLKPVDYNRGTSTADFFLALRQNSSLFTFIKGGILTQSKEEISC